MTIDSLENTTGTERAASDISKQLVVLKTSDGKSTLTVDQVKSFESEMFDCLLNGLKHEQPNRDGNWEHVLKLPNGNVADTKVFKHARRCMENKDYRAPPSWDGTLLAKMFEEQLSFFGPRPQTRAIAAQEAAKAAAIEAAKAIPAGFVRIEAGEFMMGSPDGEADHRADEVQHRVRLTQPFILKQTPMTRGEYRALQGAYPPGEGGAHVTDEHPVVNVTFYEALACCNALSRRDQLAECYDLGGWQGGGVYPGAAEVRQVEGANGYRLPTEAEWEYAARAGTTTSRYGEPDAVA